MRLHVISYAAPGRDASAAGRIIWAAVTGLRGLGHDVTIECWQHEPPGDLPPGCRWLPPPEAMLGGRRVWNVVRPRYDAARLRFDVPAGASVIAEDHMSAMAAPAGRFDLHLHHSVLLDRRALGSIRPRDVQDLRSERRARRRARRMITTSDRVARAMGRDATAAPAAFEVPPRPQPQVEEPEAAALADWRWPPNRWALDRLMKSWPDVAEQVPGSRLRLAGRGLEAVGTGTGVTVEGWVPSSAEFMARSAVLAFPAPDTSGVKVKVLEALATGLAVVTTPAGAEGIEVSDAGIDAGTSATFADRLIRLLRDPAARAAQTETGHRDVLAHHAPVPAARRRLEALGLGPKH